ncbi:hypothetical protein HYW76_04325 [Candidatus Pacearchaeota archaeon]|nr:hypothetical protein [Candidatus Pacearchaeota archaeon]
MRKIITQEEREKKESRNKVIISVVIGVILILSSVGYAFYQSDSKTTQKIDYNGIRFSLLDDGLWHAVINENSYAFSFNPQETENISANINYNLDSYTGKPLYFSYDSPGEGVQEIIRNIGGVAERYQSACVEECELDFPVKKCTEDNIIIIKDSNVTRIKQTDKCIYIFAKPEDILRASDEFLFNLLKK